MRFTRKMLSGVLLAAVAGLTACGDDAYTQDAALEGTDAAQAQQELVQRESGQTLARAVALSLRDPSMRGLLRASMRASLVKEDKLHLNSFLRGPGRSLLQAMSRQSGLSPSHLDSLLEQAGSLELYLPVASHRSSWQGGEDLLVATQLKDHEAPIAFDLQGNPVALSADASPSTPTLVLVPAEDFDASGAPSTRGLALGRGGQQLKALGNVSATAVAWTGAYVNYVSIPDDHEGWPRGAPEFEMYLERTEGGREKIRCTGAGSAMPFYWNMDGTTWSSPFLIAWDGETPTLDGLGMFFYEDDDTECVIKDDKDYLKLTLDALKNANSTYKAFQEKQYGQAAIYFYHAAVAIKSIISGGDEYVGSVASLNGAPIDGTERNFLIKNDAQQDKGSVRIQWTTRYY